MKLARPMASAASANAAAAAVTVAGAAGLGRRRHLICLAGNYGAAKYSLTHNRVNNQRASIHRIEIFIQSADWRGGGDTSATARPTIRTNQSAVGMVEGEGEREGGRCSTSVINER